MTQRVRDVPIFISKEINIEQWASDLWNNFTTISLEEEKERNVWE